MNVTIKVRNIGQNFGHDAIVVAKNGKRMHETRVVPYGMRHVAYDLAASKAESSGWTVIESDH